MLFKYKKYYQLKYVLHINIQIHIKGRINWWLEFEIP